MSDRAKKIFHKSFSEAFFAVVDASLSRLEKAVLFVLIRHYNQDHQKSFPSEKTLAAKAGYSVSKVSQGLDALKTRGIITPLGRTKGKYQTEWAINFDKLHPAKQPVRSVETTDLKPTNRKRSRSVETTYLMPQKHRRRSVETTDLNGLGRYFQTVRSVETTDKQLINSESLNQVINTTTTTINDQPRKAAGGGGEQEAIKTLTAIGVRNGMHKKLLAEHGADAILGWASAIINNPNITNKAGFLINRLDSGEEPPTPPRKMRRADVLSDQHTPHHLLTDDEYLDRCKWWKAELERDPNLTADDWAFMFQDIQRDQAHDLAKQYNILGEFQRHWKHTR